MILGIFFDDSKLGFYYNFLMIYQIQNSNTDLIFLSFFQIILIFYNHMIIKYNFQLIIHFKLEFCIILNYLILLYYLSYLF